MTKSELRIGSFYRSVKFGIPVTLDISDFSQLNYDRDGAELDEETIARTFEPIPLTAEWLLKFEFKKYFGRFYNDYIFFDQKLNIYTPKRCKDIKYVHQLQNLHFVLTGQELKYNPKN